MPKKLKKFEVHRVWSSPQEQYTTITAESKEEAIEKARDLNDDQWENCWNNDEMPEWEYTAYYTR